MEELRPGGEDGELEWKETARWIKFEEDVEEGGERWSKPFVATLALHSLFELRKGIMTGTVLLDMDANSLPQITDLVLENMVAHKHLEQENCDRVREVLLSRHRHQHDRQQSKGLPIIRSLADIGRKTSERKMDGKEGSCGTVDAKPVTDSAGHLTPGKQLSQPGLLSKKNSSKSDMTDSRNESGADISETPSTHKFNEHFAKKIPPGAEASNILVGELDFLKNPIIAFVRLSKACLLGDLTEVPVPTRFIFILLGPQGNQPRYHEIGRSIATLMSDEIFHDVAYKARNRDDLLAGIDEFLDQVTVLPPGEWDPSIRIEPPKNVPSQDARKTPGMPNGTALQEEEEEEHGDPTLVRTGRIFGGLIADIKRKLPWYISDFRDGLHIQCFASFFFVYFACLTPIITFGGLLGAALDNNMAAMESLLSGAICGVTYHLFAGQPLTIIGSTGPVLVFETIVFRFCFDQGWDYLAFRFWIGLWIGLILLIMVAFDLSALVRYITRFTEESFAALIALIFIVEAFKKLIHILDHDPINLHPDLPLDYNCSCNASETTTVASVTTSLPVLNVTMPDFDSISDKKTCLAAGGVPYGTGCDTPHYVADVFFWSCLLFIGTFTLSYSLKMFRNTRFFPNRVRSLISDFAVMIAICLMVMADALLGLETPKLVVPEEFQPTKKTRLSWVINPFVNPVYCLPAAIAPALLGTILIFMDQQITAVIVNRKENKLKKGSGYHLDLFIIALQIIVCSILGIPWFVAATVLSINHVRSLGVESECAAPGERPKFLGVREQRVTGVITFLIIGLAVLMGKVLGHIPMPVLFGVFLFMGVSSLKGVQLIQRIMIMFMPTKYQPDYAFLRHVPLRRVHLFTAIQVACLVILWVIKTIKSISIIFPLMVLAMCFVRKSLDWFFTHHELKWLDDIMPDSHKKEKEDKLKAHGDEEAPGDQMEMIGGTVKIPLTDGGAINVPIDKVMMEPEKDQVNISEEMANTAIWKQLTANEEKKKEKDGGVRERRKKKDDDGSRGKKVHSSIAEEETEKLMPGTPDIVIDPPSKTNTPDESSPLNKTSSA